MPQIIEPTTPQTITGPAIVNILTHIPYIMPSFLNSMDGLDIEFELLYKGYTQAEIDANPTLNLESQSHFKIVVSKSN